MASPELLSLRSATVKAARRLARRVSRAEARLFLAEGPQAVREALSLSGCVVEVFASAQAAESQPDISRAAAAQQVDWWLADDRAIESLAETVNPQGLVAVCRFIDRPITHVLDGSPGLVAVCADVRDPGNAGSVIRCADAAGAGAVVLTGNSVDAYNGKTVRATVGSLFHVPLAIEPDVLVTLEALKSAGLSILAADGDGELNLDDAIDNGLLGRPTAWLFGNEAWGLPDEVAALADHRVRIPIHGRAESLNLATAAAVCLYASARARR